MQVCHLWKQRPKRSPASPAEWEAITWNGMQDSVYSHSHPIHGFKVWSQSTQHGLGTAGCRCPGVPTWAEVPWVPGDVEPQSPHQWNGLVQPWTFLGLSGFRICFSVSGWHWLGCQREAVPELRRSLGAHGWARGDAEMGKGTQCDCDCYLGGSCQCHRSHLWYPDRIHCGIHTLQTPLESASEAWGLDSKNSPSLGAGCRDQIPCRTSDLLQQAAHQTRWVLSESLQRRASILMDPRNPMPNMEHETALQTAKLPHLGFFFPTCLPYRTCSFLLCAQRQSHLCEYLSAVGPLDFHKALLIFKTRWELILGTHWVLAWLLGCLENNNYCWNSAHRKCDTLSKKEKPHTGGRYLLPKIH